MSRHHDKFLVLSRRVCLQTNEAKHLQLSQCLGDGLPGYLHPLRDLRRVGGATVKVAEENEMGFSYFVVSAFTQMKDQAAQHRLRCSLQKNRHGLRHMAFS